MDLTITIASYNSCQITRQALDSIRNETNGLDYEVIVVDNASTDGSADMIADEFPWVRLIRSDHNMGFAAAHNKALTEAKGKFLLILNSDILFVNNSAGQMVRRLRMSSPDTGVIGPQIVNPDGSLAPSSRHHIFYSRRLVVLSAINQSFPFGKLLPMNFLRRYFGRLLGRMHDNFNPPDAVKEVEWLDGMCVMFRREVLEQTGLFDEQFFFDFEIGDLLVRAHTCGWRILFDPAISITHLGGYSRRKLSHIMIESHRGQLIYFAKYKPDYVPVLQWIHRVLFWVKIKLLQGVCLLLAHPDKLRERIDILKETRRVISEFNPNSVRERIPRLGG